MTKIQHNLLLLGCLVLALGGYSLPWLTSAGAGLQPNAYDMAEWLTLLPAVRINIPLMLPALFVRSSLLIVGLLLLALQNTNTNLWQHLVIWAVTLSIFVALTPPVDFFRGQFDDPNYQQQFALWAIFGISILIVLFWDVGLHNQAVQIVLVIVGLAAALGGFTWGLSILVRYEVLFTVGAGIVVYSISMIAYLVVLITQPNQKRAKRNAFTRNNSAKAAPSRQITD